ncbi:iron reductase [Mycobacterium sp. ITM-2016-00317]|uniref:iron reductase n=1 Tax=Mycobacterium sp. ITM-2016-00317 TaxID=2099694 RepID=UPI000D4B10CE|nr:iron reductase [Mycobacterium sp. ITM-2016-00317]WNG85189.1 iron reductase [Mycobacterium sp. ITM-2016-00317]
MTVLVEDPLIASMAISRTLPIHESSRRLRELYRECPRVYGVAVMGDLSRRRWWPLTDLLTTDRLTAMFEAGVAETESPAAVAQQLAATFAHVVVGRVIPLLAVEGRAWDTGLENLWAHVDSEGAIDWVGVVDPTLRALPEDPFFASRRGFRSAHDGIVALPSEAALTTWIAHRSHCALGPVFARLAAVSGGAITVAAMWHIVGATVVSAATQTPLLAGTSEVDSMRRSQAVLDALVGFGLPVRGTSRANAGKLLLN